MQDIYKINKNTIATCVQRSPSSLPVYILCVMSLTGVWLHPNSATRNLASNPLYNFQSLLICLAVLNYFPCLPNELELPYYLLPFWLLSPKKSKKGYKTAQTAAPHRGWAGTEVKGPTHATLMAKGVGRCGWTHHISFTILAVWPNLTGVQLRSIHQYVAWILYICKFV